MATLSTFYQEIKDKSFKPVYLIHGKAELLVSEALEFLLTQFRQISPSPMDIRQLDAEETDPDEVLDEALTPPLFSEKRLLVVKNADSWSPSAQRKLVPYLERPARFTILVLVGDTPGKLRVISEILSTRDAVISVDAPRERDLIEWIRRRVRLKGKNITGPAAAQLLELVGRDLRELSNALDKLITYVGQDNTIEAAQVLDALDDIRMRSIFELTDSVGNRQLAPALRALKRFLESGDSPLTVTSMLDRQFLYMLVVKAYLEKGKNLPEVAKELQQPPWMVKKFVTQSKNFSAKEIKSALELIYEADRILKRTMIPAEDYLELVVVSICSKHFQKHGRLFPQQTYNPGFTE